MKKITQNKIMTTSIWRWLLCAVVLLGITATNVSAQTVIIGANSAANTPTSYPCPLGDYYTSQRAQYLYTAAELAAAGISNGNAITNIGWVVNATTIAGHSQPGFTISLKNATLANLSTAAWETGLSVVYGPTTYNYPSGSSGNITFPVSGFTYTGGDLVVQVCHTYLATNDYTNNPAVQWTTGLSGTKQHTYRADNVTGCGTASLTNTGTVTIRPRLVVTYTGAACVGVPAPGNTIASVSTVCTGVSFNLSLQNSTSGSGVSYQWQANTGSGFANIGGATSATYAATQSVATSYQCVVTCSGGGVQASNPVSVAQNAYTACYCMPVTDYGCGDGDVIAQVILNTLNNNSGTGCPSDPVPGNQGIGQNGPGYSDYTGNGALTTTLQAGTSYTCQVWAGQYGEGYAAWIDYNDDGVFANPAERIGFSNGQVAGSGTAGVLGSSATFPISLACNPPVGPHRLRVRCMYNLSGSAVTPCTNNSYGEVEDYLITVAAPPPCPTPSALVITNPGTSTATLDWAVGCTETTWDVDYGTVGHAAGSGTIVSANTNVGYTLNGLACGATSTVFVRANCGGGNGTSAWFGPVSVTTTICPCSGTPAPGSTVGMSSTCTGGSVALSLQNATVGGGVTYQWYDMNGVIGGATSATYTTPALFADNFYYCDVTCSGNTTSSDALFIAVGVTPTGDNMADPIMIASLPYTSGGSTASCYTNAYTSANTNGSDSPDVWYQVTPCGNLMNVSLCGSGFDTYLHILDAGGNSIGFNDDSGPLCAGTASSITNFAVTPGATYYIVVEGWSTSVGTYAINVTQVDNESPVIATNADIDANNDLGMCSAVVTFSDPAATDNCGATVVCSPASGSTFPTGSTTVTCTATDASGNTAVSTFMVNVYDVEAPVITVPAMDMTVEADGSGNTAQFYDWLVTNWGDADATDNCTSAAQLDNYWVNDYSSWNAACGSTGNSGLVTFYVYDGSGNYSAGTAATFTIIDTQPPVITVPSDITISTDAGMCTSSASIGMATGVDVGSATTITSDAPSTFAVGTTTVNWTAMDDCGNTSTGTQMVTVTDGEMPTIGTNSDMSVSTDAGMCSAVVTFADPSSSDNCSVSVVCTPASGSTFPTGTTTVNCVATDASGNTASSSFMVTVADMENPTIGTNSDMSVGTDAGMCSAVVTFADPSSSDNCSVSVVCTPASGSSFAIGTTTVSCVATDAAGNMASSSFMVTVADMENPMIGTNSDMTVSTDAGMCSAVVTFADPSASDNCGTATVVCTPASGSTFASGTTTVNCVATDAAGNTSSSSFMVTVNDMEAPMIGTNSDMSVSTDAGMCSAVVTFADPSASDNCGTATVVCTPASGSTFPTGTTTVNCVATDAAGNTSSSSFMVTVADMENPTIGTNSDMSVSTDAGMCSAVVTFADPSSSDNCSASVVCTPASGSTFALGTTTVNCVATDAAGNMASSSFMVTVADMENPMIGTNSDMTVSTDAGMCSAVVTFADPSASDNCGTATVVCTPASGSTFASGTTTVNCVATDAAGNTSSSSFMVTVNDTEAPASVTLSDVTGECSATASAPTTTDNCAGTITGSTTDNTTYSTQGTHTITWTFDDGNGNTSIAMQNVVITDVTAPTITVPADITMCSSSAVNTVALGTPTVGDNCGTPSYSNDAPSTFGYGLTIVTWTVDDGNGNTATMAQNVTINQTPVGSASDVVICNGAPANVILNSTVGGSSFSWTTTPTSQVIGNQDCSNCGSTIPDVLTNTGFVHGVVSYTVTPSAGSCTGSTFTVNVTVGAAPATPVITGPQTLCGLLTATYTVVPVPEATNYTWTFPTGVTGMVYVSGQGTTTLVVSITAGTVIGDVTCTASNNCGNSGMASLAVTKKPAIPGAISGPTSVCGLPTANYSIAVIPNATSYIWTVPSGVTISGQGTNAITATFATSFISGNINVSGVNACGNAAGTAIFVTGHVPGTPGTLSGPSNVCGVTSGTYSIPPVAGATGYLWTITGAGTINGSNTGTSVSVTLNGLTGGSISCAATNVCGTGTARTLALSIAAVQPAAITGPANTCGLTTAAYSVPNTVGYTYNWVLPAGMSWPGGVAQTTSAITVNIAASVGITTANGILKVSSSNSCGSTSAQRTKSVTRCLDPMAMNNGSESNSTIFSNIYPNPASSEFTIDVTSEVDQVVTVEVYDVLGNLVISEKHQIVNGTNTMKTNIGQFENGMYFVRLLGVDSSVIHSQTMVKQ